MLHGPGEIIPFLLRKFLDKIPVKMEVSISKA